MSKRLTWSQFLPVQTKQIPRAAIPRRPETIGLTFLCSHCTAPSGSTPSASPLCPPGVPAGAIPSWESRRSRPMPDARGLPAPSLICLHAPAPGSRQNQMRRCDETVARHIGHMPCSRKTSSAQREHAATWPHGTKAWQASVAKQMEHAELSTAPPDGGESCSSRSKGSAKSGEARPPDPFWSESVTSVGSAPATGHGEAGCCRGEGPHIAVGKRSRPTARTCPRPMPVTGEATGRGGGGAARVFIEGEPRCVSASDNEEASDWCA